MVVKVEEIIRINETAKRTESKVASCETKVLEKKQKNEMAKKYSLKTHSGKNEYKTQLGQHTNIENPADALILIQRLEEKCQEKASYSITETCIWLLVHLGI